MTRGCFVIQVNLVSSPAGCTITFNGKTGQTVGILFSCLRT